MSKKFLTAAILISAAGIFLSEASPAKAHGVHIWNNNKMDIIVERDMRHNEAPLPPPRPYYEPPHHGPHHPPPPPPHHRHYDYGPRHEPPHHGPHHPPPPRHYYNDYGPWHHAPRR